MLVKPPPISYGRFFSQPSSRFSAGNAECLDAVWGSLVSVPMKELTDVKSLKQHVQNCHRLRADLVPGL